MPENPVVVIGASSAGLYAAYLLAQQKLPVRVYEASQHLATQPRTLIVTPEFTRALSISPAGMIRNQIRQMALFSPAAQARVILAQPDLIVERRALLELLATEAQAAGRPVVAALNLDGDAPRLIADARCGLCVPPEDPYALAEAVLRLYRDPGLREELGRNGRRYAEEHLSLEASVGRYEELLQRIADGGSQL